MEKTVDSSTLLVVKCGYNKTEPKGRKEFIMDNPRLMYVTVYSSELPKAGYEILHDVLEVRKTMDGKKYRIKYVESTEMGTDIASRYYNVHDTEIHIG